MLLLIVVTIFSLLGTLGMRLHCAGRSPTSFPWRKKMEEMFLGCLPEFISALFSGSLVQICLLKPNEDHSFHFTLPLAG